MRKKSYRTRLYYELLLRQLQADLVSIQKNLGYNLQIWVHHLSDSQFRVCISADRAQGCCFYGALWEFVIPRT